MGNVLTFPGGEGAMIDPSAQGELDRPVLADRAVELSQRLADVAVTCIVTLDCQNSDDTDGGGGGGSSLDDRAMHEGTTALGSEQEVTSLGDHRTPGFDVLAA